MGGTIFEFSEGNNVDELSNVIQKTKVKTKFQENILIVR